MSYTFFTIYVPDAHEPRAWAKRMSDTYGFDYDTERFGDETVCAWPLESEQALREILEEDGIAYDTFQVDDLDAFFGLGGPG